MTDNLIKDILFVDLTKIKKILIIRLSSLGDILLTTPLLRSVKKQYPGTDIDFLVKEEYKDVILFNPYINRVFTYNEREGLIEQLTEAGYDLVIDLQNNIRSRRITGRLKAPAKRFSKRSVDKFLLVNFKINKLREAPPIPVRYASTIPGFHLDEEGLDLVISDNIKSQITFDKKNIGFAPGARHFTKMWPKEYYIELGIRLGREGYKIFLFGGKDDRKICSEIAGPVDYAVDLSNDNNILQIAADMKNCSALICNDSGLMHTACAVKTPVMVFFGSTVREFGFTPYINKNLILENKLLNCRPCSHIGRESCPKGHFRCMLELTPQMAFESLLRLLNP
ncbi:MAG: glycosyltransferase family 9 protein [Ignavibacteriaceae bacterium]